MVDPYFVEGPASIAVSGGRTSAFMLRRILDAHGGKLPKNVLAVFADTGREFPETLRFVADCAREWNVDIHRVWYESTGFGTALIGSMDPSFPKDGSPFDHLVRKKKFLPNSVARFCTTELKIEPMRWFMRSRGFDEWTNVVGIRADEPRRVAKLRGREDACFDNQLPIADAGDREADVLGYWASSPFSLELMRHEGNCDLCFLKGLPARVRVAQDHPERLAPWLADEEFTGGRFDNSYGIERVARLADDARRQGNLIPDDGLPRGARRGTNVPQGRSPAAKKLSLALFDEDDLRPCSCTD